MPFGPEVGSGFHACSQQGRVFESTMRFSNGYHEPIDELSNEVRDMHRAIVSLMEELEGVD